MARNYAALPHEYLEEMEVLTDEEFGRLCRALLVYSMTGDTPDLPGAERILIKRVIMQEQRFQDSYEESSKAHKAAGKEGAKKRWAKKDGIADDSENSIAISAMADDSTARQAIAGDSTAWQKWETETNTKTNTNTPSNDGVGKKTRARFVPPTLAEVQSYVAERHSAVDPQEFIDFYASKGWMVGKTPMKDWKAACRNAEKWDRWQKKPNTQPKAVFGNTDSGDVAWMKKFL